jgi:hypothetical protein
MQKEIETLFATEAKKPGCSKCKTVKKGKYSNIQNIMMWSGTYLFFTGIYGNYVIIQKIIEYFTK